MTKAITFLKSDLFLSLAGGFALGLAGMVLLKPAQADSPAAESSRSIMVGTPDQPQADRLK